MKPIKYKGLRCGGIVKAKGNTKDTKRWCKGVVGREHQKEWVPDTRYTWTSWYSYQCAVCKKEFDYCYLRKEAWQKLFGQPPCKCGHHNPVEIPG